MTEYSQGVLEDGAAILRDGQMMTIEEILEDLRYHDRLVAALKETNQDLRESVEARYHGVRGYQSMEMARSAEMAIVKRNDSLILELSAHNGGEG